MEDSSERRGKRTPARRDIYQRRQYAAQRALIALDRVGRTASDGLPQDRERAHRWLRLWVAFAACREAGGMRSADAA